MQKVSEYPALHINQHLLSLEECEEGQFHCLDGSGCVEPAWLCDGDGDCTDGSDERDCQSGAQQCDETTSFLCRDSSCISLDSICDGLEDCAGSEDEADCDNTVNRCDVDNGGCEQICVPTGTSWHCQCWPGYQLLTNLTCEGNWEF